MGSRLHLSAAVAAGSRCNVQQQFAESCKGCPNELWRISAGRPIAPRLRSTAAGQRSPHAVRAVSNSRPCTDSRRHGRHRSSLGAEADRILRLLRPKAGDQDLRPGKRRRPHRGQRHRRRCRDEEPRPARLVGRRPTRLHRVRPPTALRRSSRWARTRGRSSWPHFCRATAVSQASPGRRTLSRGQRQPSAGPFSPRLMSAATRINPTRPPARISQVQRVSTCEPGKKPGGA
jgi:hypothetical protein